MAIFIRNGPVQSASVSTFLESWCLSLSRKMPIVYTRTAGSKGFSPVPNHKSRSLSLSLVDYAVVAVVEEGRGQLNTHREDQVFTLCYIYVAQPDSGTSAFATAPIGPLNVVCSRACLNNHSLSVAL